MIELQKNFIRRINKLAVFALYTNTTTELQPTREIKNTNIPEATISELANQLATIGDQLTLEYNYSNHFYKEIWRLFLRLVVQACLWLLNAPYWQSNCQNINELKDEEKNWCYMKKELYKRSWKFGLFKCNSCGNGPGKEQAWELKRS